MTLPYTAVTPALWDDVTVVARSDGALDVTYTRPNGNGGVWAVWIGANQAATTGAGEYDSLAGSQGAFGPVTSIYPASSYLSSSNACAFMRVIARTGSQPWLPGGFTVENMATTPIGSFPSGWFELLYYGTFTYGALNPALPITSFTARPASAIRLDKRIGLDGGAP